nr:nucleoside-diphosphate kinase [Micromonospora sp. DSM 115978]
MTTPTALEIPAYLSTLPRKRLLYAADTYFREGYEDLTQVAARGTERFCHDHALLLLKPDAVVARRLGAVLRWVIANGFTIVWADAVTIDRHGIRALWQYGLNAASRDRRDAADLYVTASECLLVVLASPGGPRAATLQLSEAKGPADPVGCRPGQLRYDVGSVNYQLNLVHTADEPADLLRELAVLCDHETRLALYRNTLAAADRSAEAFDLVRRLEAATPAVELGIEATLDDLAEAAVRTAVGDPPGPWSQFFALLGRVRVGQSRDWRTLLRLARECGIPVSRWQCIILATHLLDPYLPGVDSMLPDASSTAA